MCVVERSAFESWLAVSKDDIEEISKAVATNFLLSHLNESQQQEVFSSMEECTCAAGDTIIVAGQPGEWFYVVHSGQYDAYIDGTLIHAYKMDESEESGKHGVSFGELALLYVHQPRAASILCSSDGKLWRLHAKTFREIVMRSSTQQLLKTLRSVEVRRLPPHTRTKPSHQPVPSLGTRRRPATCV